MDLFALEALRVFEGGVYEVLAASRHLLTADDQTLVIHDLQELDLTKPWDKAIGQIVAHGKATHRDWAKSVLKSLFPFESYASDLRTSANLESLLKQSRVSHPAFFGRYFHLCIPQGDVPQMDLLRLREACAEPERLGRVLGGLHGRGLALTALQRLLAYSDEFKGEHARAFALELFKQAEGMIASYKAEGIDGLSQTVGLVIDAHLSKLGSAQERFAALEGAIGATEAAYLPAHSVQFEIGRGRPRSRGTRSATLASALLDEGQLGALKELCVRRFAEAARSGTLSQHPNLSQILSWWSRWGSDPKPPKVFFREMAESADGVLFLLDQFLGPKLDKVGIRNPDGVSAAFPSVLDDLSEYMAVAELRPFVERVSAGNLKPRERRLCDIFLELQQTYNPPVGPGSISLPPDEQATNANTSQAGESSPASQDSDPPQAGDE